MTREQIVHSMCMTWRHDYGLLPEHERNVLFSRMAQIFDNDIAYELMMQSDVENYEHQLEELEEQIQKLQEENEHLKNMLKAHTKEK